MKWRRYYWRLIGMGMLGWGGMWIFDELVHGPFTLTPANHEFWAIIIIIVGGYCISKKPHGKDL